MLILIILILALFSSCKGSKQTDSVDDIEDTLDAQISEHLENDALDNLDNLDHLDNLDNPSDLNASTTETHCRKKTHWWIGIWGIDIEMTQAHVLQSLSDDNEKKEISKLIEILSTDFLVNIQNKTTLDYQALGLKLNHIPYLPSNDQPKYKIIAKDRQGHEFQISCLTDGNVWWKTTNSNGIFIKTIEHIRTKKPTKKPTKTPTKHQTTDQINQNQLDQDQNQSDE